MPSPAANQVLLEARESAFLRKGTHDVRLSQANIRSEFADGRSAGAQAFGRVPDPSAGLHPRRPRGARNGTSITSGPGRTEEATSWHVR